jgi:F-type H+-transporting ATPase subunit a
VLWKLQPIQIQPEVIFTIFGFPITNTLIGTWISIIALLVVFFFGTRRRDMIPSGLQNALEAIVEYLISLVESVSGKTKAKKFFPLVATFFIFIVFCNLLDVIPGVDTIGTIHITVSPSPHPFLGFLPNDHPLLGIFLFGDLSAQFIAWVRPGTSDLNLTLAMALVSVITTQVFGFMTLGAKAHLSRYFNFKALFTHGFQGFIEFFVGLIEIVSEISRILSFAFRLFGNIFAGSAVLAVFAFILPFIANVVFIPLELFVAVVQALVFALLTLVFLEIATSTHEHVEGEGVEEARVEYEQLKAEHEAATVL